MTTTSPTPSPAQLSVPVEGGEMPADLHLPESGRGPGIVLYQEIFGVTAYIRRRAEDLATLGYVVLVPHLYWRLGDPVVQEGAEGLPEAVDLVGRLDWEAAVADAAAALRLLRDRDEVEGPVGVFGFCFGGGLAFNVAASTSGPAGAAEALVSYYGSALPTLLALAPQVRCPSLHHFGTADTYIPPEVQQSVREAVEQDGRADVTFCTYEGAGHAFDNPSPMFHHPQASPEAWETTSRWLSEHLPVQAGR
ncbi:dienelactone hydrolase family protein [Pedococcus sp. 5OH_020]|uniref:dienelactone hydrolase family protein n=1 Tax=Pedococcus sp. 5OH_020 TaxID=2989814 RepID=UPI0022E9D089|nr:dienelactone hydrolase family protein [Pedococcus sp. 5OH_020]